MLSDCKVLAVHDLTQSACVLANGHAHASCDQLNTSCAELCMRGEKGRGGLGVQHLCTSAKLQGPLRLHLLLHAASFRLHFRRSVPACVCTDAKMQVLLCHRQAPLRRLANAASFDAVADVT